LASVLNHPTIGGRDRYDGRALIETNEPKTGVCERLRFWRASGDANPHVVNGELLRARTRGNG
jgi:hypothetical protein